MSGPVYRIETAHEPERPGDAHPWVARVYSVNEGNCECSRFARTEAEARDAALATIASWSQHYQGHTFYTDEDGTKIVIWAFQPVGQPIRTAEE